MHLLAIYLLALWQPDLRGAVLHLPQNRLDVRVVPVVDSWHRPWTLKILPPSVPGSQLTTLAEATTDDSGLRTLRGLASGMIRLRVEDADGRTWDEQELEIYPERPEVFIAVDVVPVEGRLLFGDEPLAAELSFGTTQGSSDIRMKSGENGRFSGYLPNEGLWPLELLTTDAPYDAQRLRDVEIRRRPGKSFADLEIRVPETRLTGKVLFRGEPVADAGVNVVRELGSGTRSRTASGVVREAVLATDEDGRFRLRGLESGDLSIMATRGRLSTEWVRLELREGSWPTELILELEERQPLRGIVDFGSAPVSGARLIAMPRLSDPLRGSSYLEASTAADGTFELAVPASVRTLDLLVAAPSLGAELMLVEKGEEVWQPLIVGLGSEAGSLRCGVVATETARDFSHGLVIRRHGARLRISPVVRALTALGHLDVDAGEIVMHFLAPGSWEICLENDSGRCSSGLLAAGNDLKLPSPRVRGDDGSVAKAGGSR